MLNVKSFHMCNSDNRSKLIIIHNIDRIFQQQIYHKKVRKADAFCIFVGQKQMKQPLKMSVNLQIIQRIKWAFVLVSSGKFLATT